MTTASASTVNSPQYWHSVLATVVKCVVIFIHYISRGVFGCFQSIFFYFVSPEPFWLKAIVVHMTYVRLSVCLCSLVNKINSVFYSVAMKTGRCAHLTNKPDVFEHDMDQIKNGRGSDINAFPC